MSKVDVAILTVIPVEFRAMAKSLGISLRSREHHCGTTYYPATIYSRLLERDLRLILTCVGAPSEANASAAAAKLRPIYQPTMTVLLGIAAGRRGKLRIGDVIVPREVVDLSVRAQTADGPLPRPLIWPLSTPVKNMLPGFNVEEQALYTRCRELFGAPIVPSQEGEEEFTQHVTFAPKILDNPIGSEDALQREAGAFDRMAQIHESIRAAEMEAGGFVKSCETDYPAHPWLIVRGISDFGDNLKNDDFHRLAATAAAAWLEFFLVDGFDPGNMPSAPNNQESQHVQRSAPAADQGFVEVTAGNQSLVNPPQNLSPLAAEVFNAQIERLVTPLHADRESEFERLREEWRTRRSAGILPELRSLQGREEMRFLSEEFRGRMRRFEASLTLTLEDDLARSKELAAEADSFDPGTSAEVLRALIAHEEAGCPAALAHLVAPTTLEGWNLRLALLIEHGSLDEALGQWHTAPAGVAPDAESRRLRSLALLLAGRLMEAREEIERARTAQPSWFMPRYLGAVISYFESFSAPLFAHSRKDWPAPPDPALVKRDRVTLDALREAESTLTELLSVPQMEVGLRESLEGWRLACLANHAERRVEAQVYCAELLDRNPRHTVALTWAQARGYDVDLGPSAAAMLAELSL